QDSLEKNKGAFSKEEYEARLKGLNEAQEEELKALENDAIRQSDLYRKLNEDIIGFTRQQIRARIKELQELLKTSTTLTPQMKADIQSVIDQYNALLDQTNETSTKYEKLASDLTDISSIFSETADAIGDVDSELASVLRTLSDITSVAADA